MSEFMRSSFHDHSARAAARAEPDPDEAGRLTADARRLEPLHAIQIALDQLARKAEDRARGVPDPYGLSFAQHARDALIHARRLALVLRVAADAGAAMVAETLDQVHRLEADMARSRSPRPEHTDETPPKLTESGAPHPLQEGGYDPDADPQLPSVSDIEALKEGKTTHQQAEALAAHDVEQEPTDPIPQSAPGSDPPAEAEADEPAPARRGRPSHGRPKK